MFIFIAKKDNEIIAGISDAINMNNKLQLESMGFSIDKKSELKISEGLNFYINIDLSESIFEILGTFLNKIVAELKKSGINIIYVTCSPHLINMYEMFGFEVVDKKKLENLDEYLIKYLIE